MADIDKTIHTDNDVEIEETDGKQTDGKQTEEKDIEGTEKGTLGETDGENKLSKKQLRRQMKKERWNVRKLEKRKIERERKRQKRLRAIMEGNDVPSRKRLKRNTMKNSQCKIRVAIDCSFDSYMNDKDVCSTGQQIQYCYSSNRRVSDPLQLYVTSVEGQLKTRLESVGDYKGWDVNFHEESFMSVFDKDSIVYLSSESPNVLDTLEEDKVYVIGGLVDHNQHKGLCHQLAEERGLAHAQLPIGNYLELISRKVLAINHVFAILLNYTTSRDWEDALLKAIPNRKVAGTKEEETKDKSKTDSGEDNNKDEREEQSFTDNIKSETPSQPTDDAPRNVIENVEEPVVGE